jgi:hypothetical protein
MPHVQDYSRHADMTTAIEVAAVCDALLKGKQ